MKPKLTVRDLFWLVLVVGLALGWRMDRNRIWLREERVKGQQASIQRRDEALASALERLRALHHANQSIDGALDDLEEKLHKP